MPCFPFARKTLNGHALYNRFRKKKNKDSFMKILDLDEVGVRALIDIRLWRASRFVPFSSGTNLAAELGDRYRYMPELAPTKELLAEYKDGKITWSEYERIFNDILSERKIETLFSGVADFDKVCLFCTEKLPAQCHRRLAAEYLARHFPELKIVHL
jgi:uncharacterized protein (DUF488 family)